MNNRDVLKHFIAYLNSVKSPIITKEEITENYSDLCSLLNTCNDSYYEHGTSLLSDGEYDRLLDLLKTYEHMLPSIRSKDSPTKKIGTASQLRKGDKPYKHHPKMYSLDKVHTSDDINKWVNTISKQLKSDFIIGISKKLDGVAVKLVYTLSSKTNKAILQHCVLRGDGTTGNDLIAHVRRVYKSGKYIKGIPLEIEVNKPDDIWWEDYTTDKVTTPDYLEITGEMYISKDKLKDINMTLVHNASSEDGTSKKAKPYKSPRHAVVGLINSRHLEEVSFIVHGINSCKDKNGEYFIDMREGLTWLDATCGFNVVTNEIVRISHKNPDICQLLTIVNNITTNRINFSMEIDGIVLKVMDTMHQNLLGYTRKYPKWAIAYKFLPSSATSVLKDVRWSMSRTGVLTPIAIFEPVMISHVTYTQATLYNLAYMSSLNLRQEDIVTFKRAGDVIPVITGATIPKNSDGTSIKDGRRSIKAPTHCPHCKNTLTRDEKQLYCTNHECKGILLHKFLHLTGKKIFDLKTLRQQGYELIATLIQKKHLREPEDLFNLDFKILKSTMRRPEDISDEKYNKRINKIVDEIETCKKEKINHINMILALNIPGISESFIEKFIQVYNVKYLPELVKLHPNKEINNLTMTTFINHLSFPNIRKTIETFMSYIHHQS